VGTTQRGSFSLSDDDLHLLACIVYAESGGESYEGQLAVANVVLNRLQSGKWGSTISDVVYAKNQFSAVNTTTFANALAGSPSSTSLSAAQAAASGTNNIGSFLSFRQAKRANTSSYSSYTIIGNHCFY
jgi:spore germination cell wall hydrolase CwlJ-like protein